MSATYAKCCVINIHALSTRDEEAVQGVGVAAKAGI